MNVLVIDDEEGMRLLLEAFLKDETSTVLLAENGPQGLELVRENSVNLDLVITDRQMPGGMLGEEVVRSIKSHYPWIKVILMTGDSDEVIKEVAIAAGADLTIYKPFQLKDLIDEIEKLFIREV